MLGTANFIYIGLVLLNTMFTKGIISVFMLNKLGLISYSFAYTRRTETCPETKHVWHFLIVTYRL